MSCALRWRTAFTWLVFLSVEISLFLAFLYAPPDVVLGETQRIFYFHVASAWNGLLAFTVVFVAAVAYLMKRTPEWDRLALASTEIGVVFITMGVVTGSIWARFAWGVWWEWEPRLTSSFVLWLMYVTLLVLRNLVEDPDRRARLSAVFGIVAFVDVPVVFMSIRWWRSVHPVVVEAGGKLNLEPPMVLALVASVISFTLLYLLLLMERLTISKLEADLADIKRTWKERTSGVE